MKGSIKYLTVLLLAAGGLIGCERDYDAPPLENLPLGQVMTVGQLRALYSDEPVHFEEGTSVYAVVTADERSGNLYREVYVAGDNAALQLRLQDPGGLYIGDSIRIYLPGTVLSSYRGMLQLDSVDVDKNIVKQATNVPVKPLEVTIEEISPGIQAQLVKLDSVEFVQNALGETYANPENLTDENRTLTNCQGDEVIVRTSGYADFAGDTVAEGNGSFAAIVSQFQTTMQLTIRNLADVQLNGQRCQGSSGGGDTLCDPFTTINESFDNVEAEEPFANPCWYNIATQGSRKWLGKTFQDNVYLQATAYNSSDPENEMWLITPPIQFSGNNTLTFETAQSFYEHDGLKVFISKDYNGSGNVNSASWLPVTANLAGSNSASNAWVDSGPVDVSGYLPQSYSGIFFIGFRYQGNNDAGETTSYRIDDVSITQ